MKEQHLGFWLCNAECLKSQKWIILVNVVTVRVVKMHRTLLVKDVILTSLSVFSVSAVTVDQKFTTL